MCVPLSPPLPGKGLAGAVSGHDTQQERGATRSRWEGAKRVRRWSWVVLAVAAAVIGAGAFAAGMMWGNGEKTQEVKLPQPSPDERELQMIRVAASNSKLAEARREGAGWIVRVGQESPSLDPRGAQEAAVRFFRELARTSVPVAEASFEITTNALKDVWGNKLYDVPIFRVGLGRETFERINWGGFEPQNLERVADEYWEHDLLRQSRATGGSQGGGGGQGAPREQGGPSEAAQE